MNRLKWPGEQVIIAYIGAAATIIAAIVGAVIAGIFLVGVSKSGSPPPLSTPTTVISSTLATVTPSVTAVSTSIPTPSSALVLNDPLGHQDEYQWVEDTYNDGHCAFIGETYHASATQQGSDNFCTANGTDGFRNFIYQAQMQIIKGDCGGLIFRADTTNGNTASFYYFEVCQDGSYDVTTFLKGNHIYLIGRTKSSAIYQGFQQRNLLEVVTNASTLDFYVNNQKIDSISDNSFRSGQIGIMARSYDNPPTEVAFSNAKVWLLRGP